jgi:hypothetical protein
VLASASSLAELKSTLIVELTGVLGPSNLTEQATRVFDRRGERKLVPLRDVPNDRFGDYLFMRPGLSLESDSAVRHIQLDVSSA